MKVRAKIGFTSASEGLVSVGDVIEVSEDRGSELKEAGLCVGAPANADLVHAEPMPAPLVQPKAKR